MNKRIIIVHCWEGTPDYVWYPWLKEQLEKKGVKVDVLAMPDTEEPKIEGWLPHLIKEAGEVNEQTYFVGHSLGCITILRFLQQLTPDAKVGGAVLVAGFSNNLGFAEIDSFFQESLDWQKIKSHCNNFVAIHSDDDPYVPLEHAEIFQNNLDAKVIIKERAGHFSRELLSVEGKEPKWGEVTWKEFPDALISLEEMGV